MKKILFLVSICFWVCAQDKPAMFIRNETGTNATSIIRIGVINMPTNISELNTNWHMQVSTDQWLCDWTNFSKIYGVNGERAYSDIVGYGFERLPNASFRMAYQAHTNSPATNQTLSIKP